MNANSFFIFRYTLPVFDVSMIQDFSKKNTATNRNRNLDY